MNPILYYCTTRVLPPNFFKKCQIVLTPKTNDKLQIYILEIKSTHQMNIILDKVSFGWIFHYQKIFGTMCRKSNSKSQVILIRSSWSIAVWRWITFRVSHINPINVKIMQTFSSGENLLLVGTPSWRTILDENWSIEF